MRRSIIDNINISEFDNNITIAYKIAAKIQYPVRYVVVMNDTFVSIPTLIRMSIKESFDNKSSSANTIDSKLFGSIYNRYKLTIDTNITPYEFAMTCVQLIMSDSQFNVNLPNVQNDLLQQFNQFLSNNGFGIRVLNNFRDLDLERNEWFNKVIIADYLKDTYKKIAVINHNESTLNRVKQANPPIISPFEQLSIQMMYTPKWKLPVTPDMGIDIFNDAKLSADLPFLRYVSSTNTYHKVHRGPRDDLQPDYDTTTLPYEEKLNPNIISGLIFNSTERERKVKKLYFTFNYYLTTNSLIVTIPRESTQTDKIVNIIRSGLGIELGLGSPLSVNGYFDIYYNHIANYSFADMVLRDSLLNFYLYIEESKEPLYIKKRLDILYKQLTADFNVATPYYVNPALLSITLANKTTPAEVIVNQISSWNLLDVKLGIKLGVNTNYIRVNVSRAINKEYINEFMNLFRLIFNYYQSQRDQLERSTYIPIIPELKQLGESKNLISEVKTSKTGESKNPVLKSFQQFGSQFDVNMFSNYSTACPNMRRGVIIGDSEVEVSNVSPNVAQVRTDIQRPDLQPIMSSNGIPIRRTAIRYPKDSDKHIWFVCPARFTVDAFGNQVMTDDYPFPGMKNNDVKSESYAKYPMIPCCYGEDQLYANNGGFRKTGLTEYYGIVESTETKISRTRQYVSKAIKRLLSNQYTSIPYQLETLILKDLPGQTELYRFGSIEDPNSVLYCIMYALHNEFRELPEAVQRQNIRQIRIDMLKVEPMALKQEAFDYTANEIKALFASQQTFDPLLFYRAIELYFGINLFTFNIGKESKKIAINIMPPRHKEYHVALPIANQVTILIIRHNANYCELIGIDPSNPRFAFDNKIATTCRQLLIKTHPVTTYQSPDQNPIKIVNLASNVTFPLPNDSKLTGQYVDTYGKLRAINFNYANIEYTMITFPYAALNISAITTFNFPDYSQVVTIMGQPIGKCINDSQIIGLWYSIDKVKFAILMLIKPLEVSKLNLPVGPNIPIDIPKYESKLSLSKIDDMKRTVNLIIQLTQWLFSLSRLSVNVFFQNYIQYRELKVYDYKINVTRVLPIVTDVKSAISWIGDHSNLISDNKFTVHNQTFYNKLKYNIEQWRNSRADLTPPTVIAEFYRNEHDFTSQHRVSVLIGRSYDEWKSRGVFNIKTYENISLSFFTEIDPIFYSGKSTYIIQNVEHGKLSSAINVCQIWKTKRINDGYLSIVSQEHPEPDLKVPHKMYEIDVNGLIKQSSDNSQGQSDYIELLNYLPQHEPKWYAAMLPVA